MTIPNSGALLSDRHIATASTSADVGLRPETMAAIRAAKNIWLDDGDAETRSQNIDAFIDLLIDQTAQARRSR